MRSDKVLECFVGAWGFLNATLTNTTTGAIIPEWHSRYPSGITVYSPSGYNSFIITANDTTQPEYRPKDVTLPAKPTDPITSWATIAQHSLAAGGPFQLTNITQDKCGKRGPAGDMLAHFTTATLPAWVGLQLDNKFEFFDNCNVHVLRTFFGVDILQTVYFFRKQPVAY